jgi:ADP-ribose pyrophosphatase YjhB (NUDIX family)
MENLWLARAKRLQAIASTGLHFCDSVFDRERYDEVAQIANAMLAELGNVPLGRIEGLVGDFAKGYATPKVDVRGALIEGDHILLVREKSDGLWTMPGGFADVGKSAAENICKEIEEEAGLHVTARRPFSIRHKAKHAYDPDPRDFYKIFFLCERAAAGMPRAGAETNGADFFPRGELPPLSRGRVLESDIEAAFLFHEDPTRIMLFD